MDFVFDATIDGQTLKWLTVHDEYTRECLAIHVDRRIEPSGERNANRPNAGDHSGVIAEPRIGRRVDRRDQLQIGIGSRQGHEPLPHPPGGAVNRDTSFWHG